jgi:serine/threonine protein kinase
MGAVYEARHAIIGKRVAVKVLAGEVPGEPGVGGPPLQEARLASSIGHENIVDVTDYGTTSDGRAFVVMEFLDGEPLAQLVMRDAPLPVERSLGILRQVCSALSAAHAKGIVHRDVKPENIYLVRRGEVDFVKVVDFGVSKAVHSREEGPDLAAPDPHGCGAGYAAVHVARAGARRRGCGPPGRHLERGADAV